MTKHQSVYRRRTLSLADVPDCRKSSPANATENHEIDFSKAFHRNMVRCPSFALLDISQNSSNELACLKLQNTLKNSNSQLKSVCEPNKLHTSLKSDSNSQTASSSLTSSLSFFEPYPADELPDVIQPFNEHNIQLSSTNLSQLNFMDYLLPSSLLSSSLVKLYLSKVTTGSSLKSVTSYLGPDNEEAKFHHTDSQNLVGIPGCLQIASHSLVSMVMPIKNVEIYSNRNTKKRLSLYSSNGSLKLPQFMLHSCDKDMLREVNYSSSTESSNTAEDTSNFSSGYYSDNYFRGEKKCDNSGGRLEMKFHHPSHRIPLFSDGHLKSNPAYISNVDLHHHIRHRKFALTNIYAGLNSSKGNGSSGSSNPTQSHSNYVGGKSNSATTNFNQSSMTSVHEHTRSCGALERLCSLWTNLKLDIAEEEKFYYMDERSLERRVHAQASNIISPVSF
ncbi:unnamed protein product [Heterobilharzia americana]|nr:unnamed protein product [Heterobilharzia americana]